MTVSPVLADARDRLEQALFEIRPVIAGQDVASAVAGGRLRRPGGDPGSGVGSTEPPKSGGAGSAGAGAGKGRA